MPKKNFISADSVCKTYQHMTEQSPQKQPEFELNTSRQFVAWLSTSKTI